MKTILKVLLTIFIAQSVYSQVGIGTTNPASGSILDVYAEDKGIMIPRIHLNGTDDSAAITPAPTVSMLVYNTNDSDTGPNEVSQGFYYWNGTQWVRLMTAGNYWNIDGNDNIVNGTHFLGTTTNADLDFKTNNQSRLKIPGNANQLYAMANGTQAAPFYSWYSDTNTGMYLAGNNQLAFSAGGVEFLRLNGATNELVVNENNTNISTRIETNNHQNMLYINGGNNRIGIKTNNPQTELHLAENGSTLRIDELNKVNNIHYISNDPMPVYVDTDGNIQLQPSLVQNFMPVNLVDFLNPGHVISSEYGTGTINDLQTVNITLTQESLVQINYQMSVDITNFDGTQIEDGASRMFRAWVEVNGSATHIAYDSGAYSSRPIDITGNDANSGYYLSGNGYVQLPAGNHTFVLRALAFAGDLDGTGTFSYRMVFGDDENDRMMITVHR